jgi:hypothetical protein
VVTLGPNIIQNAGFHGGANWTANVVGDGVIEFIDDRVHLLRPAAGDSIQLFQNPPLPGGVGKQYQIKASYQRVTGTMRIAIGGAFLDFATTAEKAGIVTAINTGQFSILPTGGVPMEGYFDYVSLREVGVSMSKVVLTLRDYDGDKKQTSVELGPVTDGPSYVTREAQAAAIRDAVNTVAGNIANYDFLAQSDEPNNLNTATPVFQTHVRWIVELFDSVTGDGPYAFDIPTADLGTAGLFLPASVEHDPAHAAWIALKAALNGIAINPRTASTMTVGRIYLEE